MTSTELIKDMLERQKSYDEEVSKKHNVDYVSKSQLESALFDELKKKGYFKNIKCDSNVRVKNILANCEVV